MDRLYTIGHSNQSLDYFMELLSKHGINTVIDVRSIPYSRYVPHFNKEGIRDTLKSKGIHCLYMAKEFGMVQGDEYFHPDGYVDFSRVQESKHFAAGVERVKTGIEMGYKIALMCAEKDPIDCHRSIMIAPAFTAEGYRVLHILEEGSLQSQEELEERLIDMYFPESNQQDFFSVIEGERDHEELLRKALQLRNRDIGYRKKEKRRED